jgi:hypothetical protein
MHSQSHIKYIQLASPNCIVRTNTATNSHVVSNPAIPKPVKNDSNDDGAEER